MTAAAFAAWVLTHFELDCWVTEATIQRRLAGIKNHHLSAGRLLAALRSAGWVEAHPKYPGEYCLASKCWLSEKPKADAGGHPVGSQSIAHS